MEKIPEREKEAKGKNPAEKRKPLSLGRRILEKLRGHLERVKRISKGKESKDKENQKWYIETLKQKKLDERAERQILTFERTAGYQVRIQEECVRRYRLEVERMRKVEQTLKSQIAEAKSRIAREQRAIRDMEVVGRMDLRLPLSRQVDNERRALKKLEELLEENGTKMKDGEEALSQQEKLTEEVRKIVEKRGKSQVRRAKMEKKLVEEREKKGWEEWKRDHPERIDDKGKIIPSSELVKKGREEEGKRK